MILSRRKLVPADLRKDAGAFDLPIALGLLVATDQVKPEQLTDAAAVGELALDGTVRPVKGALSIALARRLLLTVTRGWVSDQRLLSPPLLDHDGRVCGRSGEWHDRPIRPPPTG